MSSPQFHGRAAELESAAASTVAALVRGGNGLRLGPVTGPPGRGKRAFLRALAGELERVGAPFPVFHVAEGEDKLPETEAPIAACVIAERFPADGAQPLPTWVEQVDAWVTGGTSVWLWFRVAPGERADFPWPGTARVDPQPVLALPPLSADAMQAIATDANAPKEVMSSLLTQADGNPGTLLAAVDEAQERNRPQESRAAWLAAIGAWDERSLRVLADATVLGQWCGDGLRWLGHDDVAQGPEFARVIAELAALPGALDAAGRFTPAFVAWMAEESGRTGSRRPIEGEKWANVIAALPEESAREALLPFARCAFFDASLASELVGMSGNEFEDFTAQFSPVLGQTERNYFILPAAQRALWDYAELIGAPKQDEAVQRAWADRRSKLESALGMARTNGQKAKSELGQISEALEKVRKRLRSVKVTPPAPVMPTFTVPVHMRTAGSFVLEIVGVALLYVSILFFQEFKPGYFAAGIGCILLGLLGAIWRDTPEPAVAAPVRPAVTPPVRERRLWELRREQLSLRKTHWSARRAEAQREITRLEQLLQEPYALADNTD